MKRKLLTVVLIICVLSVTLVGLVGCDNFGEPEKLNTPILFLDGDIARWDANPKASNFEISIGGSVFKVDNDVTARKLVDGVTIKVRAVGDGEKYLTSEWSNPLTYSAVSNGTKEPAHVKTTISNLAIGSAPDENIVYEVSGVWTLKENSETYGNGWLTDSSGNQIAVYGLCKTSSVLSWNGSKYIYYNDKSYTAIGLNDGDTIKVGMIYSASHDNYSCYLIEIVDRADVIVPPEGTTDINFIMINDTHGALTDSPSGYSIGRVDTLVETLEDQKGDYIFIHNGDAFQGSYVSGETYGRAMIDAMNGMSLDCFVIGNHEFDWGLDKIRQYADGNYANGEANFPFLGANIYLAGTTDRPDWINPYVVVEQDDMKIGIIGTIGYGQESSILTRYVKNYEFGDPLPVIRSYARYLRESEGCDAVVVATHDYDEGTNEAIAGLTGAERIDSIFCAHTHENISESVLRGDGKRIPVVQCLHKNNNASEVILRYDENGQYYNYVSTKHYPANYDISGSVRSVIDIYSDEIADSETVLGTTNYNISKSKLGAYATESLLEYDYPTYNYGTIDVSIINTGGVRASIDAGDITKADVFEVFPFNNAVVLVNMSGKLLKSLCSQNEDFFYIDVADSIGSYSNLKDNTIYQLAVIDYVFEGTRYYQFSSLDEDDFVQTDILMRDLLLAYFEENY